MRDKKLLDRYWHVFCKKISRHVDQDRGMTGGLLESLAKNEAPRYFYGVYLSSNLPNPSDLKKKYSNGFTLIINIVNKKMEGGHFVTLHIRPGLCLYIDSYGMSIMDNSIKKFIRAHKDFFKFEFPHINIRCIQSPFSKACGMYSLLFTKMFEIENLYQMNTKFIMYWSKNLLLNDKLCMKYLTKIK